MDNRRIGGRGAGRLRRFIRRAPGYCIRSLIAAIALLFVLCIYVLVAPLALYDWRIKHRKTRTRNRHAIQ